MADVEISTAIKPYMFKMEQISKGARTTTHEDVIDEIVANYICIVQWNDSKLEVVYEAEMQAPLMEDVRKQIPQLIQKYHICRCYIDQSSSVLIRQLCSDYGETIRYDLIDEDMREQLLLGTDCR
jgi:hypothetical protein